MNWYPPCGKNCPVPSDCSEIRLCKEAQNARRRNQGLNATTQRTEVDAAHNLRAIEESK